MHINITLFIQIVNFLITYKILATFLFKPIIASIEGQEAKKESYETTIYEQREELSLLEKKKKQAVRDFQQQIATQYPFHAPSILSKPLEIPYVQKAIIDEEKMKSEIVDWIVTKVPNVY